MAPSTRSQLLCKGRGGPFEVASSPTPALAPDEVLIRQKVIALNPLDYKQRDEGLMVEKWPYVLGIEGAGIVEAIGSAVTAIAVGAEVTCRMIGHALAEGRGGAYQELVVVPAAEVIRKPANITLAEAASLPVCYSTAVYAIHGSLKIPLPYIRGMSTTDFIPKSILILGGASVTGAWAIQLLRLAYPLLPILTTSSPRHHARLLSLGATKALDYHSSTLVKDLKEASPDQEGVDAIIDCVASGASQKDICDVFSSQGSHLYSAIETGIPFEVPDHVTRIGVVAVDLTVFPGGENILSALTGLVEELKCKVPLPVRVVGTKLEHLPAAMDQMKTMSGEKLVVTLGQ